ncbi:MAG: AbrB/MazE/SpoVT family DNA-binding domain-containing protein [Pseudonocardiales bacterium]|nr:AbrB/MazE/SpoVT family DNA-binding domain-containing protein [Pseudonocardiales bacterium]
MRTTVDAGGRVVVPKAIRDRLALHTGSEVEVIESDGSVVVTPVTERVPMAEEAGILVIAPTGQPLTADQVRALRDATRR